MEAPVRGAVAYSPTRSAPAKERMGVTSRFCSASLRSAEELTIHSSPSTLASEYSAFGSTQRLVAPKTVSGLRVPATRAKSPSLNFNRLNSSGETPSPSSLSWSPVGLWSREHQTTGCVPCTT